MELLYLWVENQNYGFFENQGFNFSPEYDFHMDPDPENKGNWILRQNKRWIGKNNIFRHQNIENVTAIVGKNGSGKTTLLSALVEMQGAIRKKDRPYKMLFILKKEKTIKIFCNYPRTWIRNMTRYDWGRTKEDYELSKELYPVYLTNSHYTHLLSQPQQGIYDVEKKLNHYRTQHPIRGEFLSPALVEEKIKVMFREAIGDDQEKESDSENDLEDVFQEYYTKHFFESSVGAFMDMMYLSRMLVKEKKKPLLGKIPETIEIEVQDPKEAIKEMMDLETAAEHKELLARYLEQIEELEKQYPKYVKIPFIKLMIHLIVFSFSMLEEDIPSDLDLEALSMPNNEVYASNGLSDIIEILTSVYGENIALRESLSISYQDEPERYEKFLAVFNHEISDEAFVIMMFFNVTLPGVSSGERAFQNILSWLNITLDEMDADTILLILDEMDLYFHPEWQRKYLNVLMKGLKDYFSEYHFQIVCATHSPICLSEIPRENTIYLSGDVHSHKGQVDDRLSHVQTFGKDVYSLLNDAFFLGNSTMGEYAEMYINGIIREIKSGEMTDQKYQRLTKKIDILGNELVKKKLTQMLNDSADRKQLRLLQLKAERDRLDQMIKELEN